MISRAHGAMTTSTRIGIMGNRRDHLRSIAHLGAAARWADGPTNKTEAGWKRRARSAVRRALNSGKLVRPSTCPRCGSPERFGGDGRSLMHAHHHRGYDNQTDVQWLCIDCHFQEDPRLSHEENGNAKLDWPTVREIRRRYQPGKTKRGGANSLRALAREFGVHNATIGRIVKNQIWKDDS